MNRFLLLIFTGILLPIFSGAQSLTAAVELSRRDPLPRFFEVSSTDNGLVTFGNMVRNSSRYLGVFKYNNGFEKEWSKQVLEQNGRNNVDFMTVIGDNIMVFVSEFFPKENAIRTFLYRLDLKGNILNDHKVISQLTNEKEHRVDLKYVVSLNRKRLLCYRNFNTQAGKEKILYYQFDETGEQIREGEIEFPFSDDEFSVRKVLVSNQGNVFVLGKHFNQSKVRSPEDFEFLIFRFEGVNPQQMAAFTLKFEDRYVTDINIKVDRDENVYAAGFFSNRSTFEIGGTVFMKFSADGEELVSFAEKFSDDFLSKFLSGKQIERGLELKYFYLDDIVLRSDGGVLLVAEKYYTTFSSMLDMYGYWVDRQIHHYDEIIVNSVSADGIIEWSTVIPKFQSSESNVNLSYFSMVTSEGIDLIYQYSPRGMPETIYRNHVEMDGKTGETQVLLPAIGRNVSFFPRSCAQVNNKEGVIVFYRQKERGYSIMRIDFSE